MVTAVCENCGAIGVKHSFYTKRRNYCSQDCVKAAMEKTDDFLQESQQKNITNETESSSMSVNDEQSHPQMVYF